MLTVAPGQGADFFGLPLAEVRFSPAPDFGGAPRLAPGLRVGRPLSPDAIQQSIQTLFRTGRYEDIQVDADRTPAGVRLTFVTEPAWFIGEVSVAGVARSPSAGQLLNATKLRLGELFTEEKLGLAVRSLRSLLRSHGFPEAAVESCLVRHPDTQQVDIEFQVAAGVRARIGAVLVAGADPPLSADEIREIAAWPRGAEYRRVRILRGVDRLRRHFHSQGRWHVRVRAEDAEYRAADNEMTLVASIVAGPRLRVRLEGLQLGSRRLRGYLPIYAGGAADSTLLEAGSANLREHLQGQGYFRAAVDYEVEQSTPELVSIVYRVDRGPRFSLRAVEIRGNRHLDAATIRERLQMRPADGPERRGRFSEFLLEQDLQAVRALYRSNGFREVEASGRLVEGYLGKPNQLAVRIDISEGTRTVVAGLVTAGLEAFPADETIFDFAAAPGQPFSEVNVAADRRRVLAEFYAVGYQSVSFAWRTEPADQGQAVVLYYDIDHGLPVRLARPIISGLQQTRDEVVRRRLALVPGGPLSQDSMFATQRNLYDLGVFSKVEVALQNPDGLEEAKNVLVQLEEARRWAVGFGGGAEFARIGRNTAELTNPVGDAGFSPRATLEMTRLNVRGKAHTMSFRTRLSLLQQRGLFTYQAPRWFDSDRWTMTVTGLYDTFRNVNTFTGRRFEGAFQLTQQLNRTQTVLYRYAYRRTSIDESTLNIQPLLVPLIAQPVRVGLLAGTLISDRRDDPTDTSAGIYNTVNLALASKFWGAQPNFARLLAQNSTYHRLWESWVFARTVQFGVTLPWAGHGIEGVQPADFATRPDPRIPLSERYFAGGANSHRGFPYNQAGPRDPATGFPLGGGAQFLNSLELRFPLAVAGIGGVLFHDAGNVFSRPGRISFRQRQQVRVGTDGANRFDFDYMVHAIGLGVRYKTAIGPVRLDFAYSPNAPRFVGFDGTRAELLTGTGAFREQRISALQFHFSLGQTF